jgi:hypothetical protein
MPDNETDLPEPRPQRGYPLSALFVLIAVCAILAAMLAPVLRAAVAGRFPPDDLASVVMGSGIAIGLLGVFIGLHHHRRRYGMGIGVATGAVMAALIGPLLLTPHRQFPSLIAAALGGSAALLLVGVVAGLARDKKP